MIKIDIKNWMTGEVKFTANIECEKTDSDSIKFGFALKWAVENKEDLWGARLVGARLVGARLDGARLDGARLDGARLDGARLDGASLDGASLVGARLDGARLDGARLDGARLDGARLDGASLDGASLVGARLDGAYIFFNRNKIKLIGKRPIVQVGPIGSRSSYLISYNTKNGIYIKAGCWFGTIDEFYIRVKSIHEKNEFSKEYANAVDFIKSTMKIWEEKKKLKEKE